MMAEREDRSRPSPITADVDARLGAYTGSHSRRRRSSRRGPSWLFILLLMAAFAGLAYWGDQRYQEIEERLNELQGRLSNVYARFDGSAPAEAGALEARLEDMARQQETRQQQVNARLDEQQEALAGLDRRFVDQEGQARIEQRLEDLAKTQQELNALLAAMDDSLNALEKNSQSARDILKARLDTQQRRLEQLSESLQQGRQRQSAQEVVGASLMVATRTLENQLEKLRKSLDTLQMQQAQDHDMLESLEETLVERIAKLDEQLDSQQDSLRELRQVQVALSAQLEMLQGTP
ncbi:hypothetical protein FGL86_13340 [Pistricoccus aurantiacus]|uniref:Uncharacterized protein n=1 Tax=Pistricoccus aurantiacus TaxID=1883414 RepID=A0A5B8SYR2_9GAMM|nr:hypothetical protein [Pistricoccus aurantiacus]QEA39960.1 hypothetical protein FGL86_13340 [Pistricoccus aurantiacus]